MIYKKDANFPYPILTNTTSTYMNPYFSLDVNLEENTNAYRFVLDYEISSPFIKELIHQYKATVVFIIQSKDTRFVKLAPNQRYVDIEKSRISLNKRTSIQLQIQTAEDISFALNEDLTAFYDPFKVDIKLCQNKLLGYSNVVVFEGSIQQPLVLFEKKLDENLTSDIKIELGTETIIIHYKKADFQFNGMRNSRDFNTPYLYLGMQKALQNFVSEYGRDEGAVDLTQVDVPESGLDYKLYNLMTKKMITEVSTENIDEVITLISEKLIEKYSAAVRELDQNGD
ncbi:hypothetical protein NSQ62_01635 [Solibacillus sp. FSL H8-0523]|uniref:hypothetical protein n=1 Tax=Solibacillus sp. FSL H8-0523 TaxID=2954511 RepID=UPI0031017426